jgi:hypothetical protein
MPELSRCAVELAARGDAQFAEDLAEVILHGARADEEAGADLWFVSPL